MPPFGERQQHFLGNDGRHEKNLSLSAVCLRFDGRAEEAARFYTSPFSGTRIDPVERSTIDWPGGVSVT